jgi:hypothetical protein
MGSGDMTQQRVFGFEERLMISEGISDSYDIEQIISHTIPSVTKIQKSNLSEDMIGVDYWATLESGRRIGIDVKSREDDWWKHHPLEDDIALETWSKIERDEKGMIIGGKIGWTRNVKKQTDWVLFVWAETGRYFYLPFPWLCSVFTRNWRQWCQVYKTRSQFSISLDGSIWESECVFVPRRLLGNTVCKDFAGTYSAHEESA